MGSWSGSRESEFPPTPKNAACNNGAGGFTEGTSNAQIHVVLPQGKIKNS